MKKLLIGLLVLAFSQTCLAQVQKCQDTKNGAITYSDGGCPTGTKSNKTIAIDMLPTPARALKGKSQIDTREQPESFRNQDPQDVQIEHKAGGQCYRTTIQEPQPFLGTENEIVVFQDGSIWKDVSYKYLYLYAYSPSVLLCPSQGRMLLDKHVFQLVRIR